MAFGRSRRGSASGIAAVMVAIMVVTTAVSGAIIYFSRSGSSPAIGTNSPANNGLSGALSDPALANLTSALGGLSDALSNSTLANFTAALGGQVEVTDMAFPAEGFTSAGTTSTFTCAASPSAAYLALTENDTGSASVSSVSIVSAEAVTTFTPSGGCDIGAGGSGAATTYIIFPATSQISPSPLSGSYYAGVVTLSDGTPIPFEGVWQ